MNLDEKVEYWLSEIYKPKIEGVVIRRLPPMESVLCKRLFVVTMEMKKILTDQTKVWFIRKGKTADYLIAITNQFSIMLHILSSHIDEHDRVIGVLEVLLKIDKSNINKCFRLPRDKNVTQEEIDIVKSGKLKCNEILNSQLIRKIKNLVNQDEIAP